MSDDFKGQSPWGAPPSGGGSGNGSGRGPTPPNVDELIRDLQDKIKRFLPGGKTSGGKSISLILLVLVFVWLASGLYRVLPDEQGVVLKEFNEDGVPPETPILDYTIKGTITDWGLNSFSNSNFLLTKNGNITDGSGSTPDFWTKDSAWSWDQTNGKLVCSGTTGSINRKVYNHNDNRDIVDGGKYKIKYKRCPSFIV